MKALTLLSAAAAALLVLPGAAAAQEPQRGGTLNWAIAAEPPTYDCHSTGTFATMQRVAPHYSTLMKFEPGNYPNIVGDLAQSWTIAPDSLTYSFKLHPGVKFHDGTTLTSEDVKATYERIMKPPEGVISNRQSSFVKVASVEAPDPSTVVFKMKEVDASMMTNFASPWNCVYSAARLKADPTFPAKNVMGTGPFKFVEHVAGSHWRGERFQDYFRKGHPYLDGFRAVTMSSASMANALAGKQVDAEFRGFSPTERDRIVRALGKDAKVQQSSWLLHMIVTFNTSRKPFDDPRVRRALSLAIDRWGGSASLSRISSLGAVGGLVRPGSEWSASEKEMEQWPGYGRDMAANRAEARRLLKEAGQENLTLTLMDRNIAPYVTAGIYVIDQWRQIGVKAEHQQVELASWYSIQNGGTFDAFIDSFTQFSDDPSNVLYKYASYDRSPVAVHRAIDRDLDALFDEQARTPEKEKRIALIRRFEKRLFEQAYSVPLLWWQRIVVMNDKVKGWTMSPTHMIYQDLGDVWLAGDK